MKTLYGKRLLILGGSLWKDVVKKYADEKGITLVAAGNNCASGIFEIATEGYFVDSTDKEAMKKFIAEKHIDGVYMGGSELVLSAASEYLNEMGLPCYCTKRQWDFLENKATFKNLCMEYGLPVAKSYFVNKETLKRDAEKIKFPVVTKPQDGCGSDGFSICRNLEDLIAGYALAEVASPTARVLCEDFLKNDSIVVFYTFSAGKMLFSGLEDKFPIYYPEEGRYVAGAHIFESDATEEFRTLFEEKLRRLFASLHIKEGSIWIEIFHSGNEYYFNEAGYRYSGSVSIYPIDYFYGINQVACDINYALLGDSLLEDKQKSANLIPETFDKKRKYCIYSLHVTPGTITTVIGIEEMLRHPDVVVIPVTKTIGNRVEASGTVGQVFAFVHFVFDTMEELERIIDIVHETIKIFDENGKNMIQRRVSVKHIRERLQV